MTTKPKQLYWEQVDEGQDLPEDVRPITATDIIAGAVWASHDFMPVHHDPKFAQEKGAPDIFMNILTDNGLVGAYLGNCLGPEAELKKLKIGLAVPCYPGHTLKMNGTVTRKYEKAGEHLIEVKITGENEMGPHVSGDAVLALPTKG
jgi:acyl dehydratase